MREPSLQITALSAAQRAQALKRFTFVRPALEKEVSQAHVACTHHLPPGTVQLWITSISEGLAELAAVEGRGARVQQVIRWRDLLDSLPINKRTGSVGDR